MPDERKNPETIEAETKVPAGEQATAAPAPSANPGIFYAVAGVVIAALLVALFILTVQRKKHQSTADQKEIQALTADLQASRADLNRERTSLGLRPLENGSESAEDIAKRLNKDAGTLVALANSFQKLIEEKNQELDGKSKELLRAEQLRKTLVAENSRLQAEVSRQMVEGADGTLAKKELAGVQAQRDVLAAELAKARDAAAAAGGQSNDEFLSLQRRYEEAVRAKDFYEKRVKELEGGSPGPLVPAQ